MICREIMKRLQQECTEKTDYIIALEKQLKCTQTQHIKVIEQNKSLQQELRVREQEYDRLQTKFIDELKAANNELAVYTSICTSARELQGKTETQKDRYKQALEKIEKIVNSNRCEGDNCDECPFACECNLKDITIIINEVKDAD